MASLLSSMARSIFWTSASRIWRCLLLLQLFLAILDICLLVRSSASCCGARRCLLCWWFVSGRLRCSSSRVLAEASARRALASRRSASYKDCRTFSSRRRTSACLFRASASSALTWPSFFLISPSLRATSSSLCWTSASLSRSYIQTDSLARYDLNVVCKGLRTRAAASRSGKN